MQVGAGLGRKKARAPVAVGEIHRLLKEGRLVEGDVELAPRPSAASANRRSPPQAPPQMARSLDPRPSSASADAMARAATASLPGGKRGLARPGASIMWPLNRTALRGGSRLDSGMLGLRA
jgi:hypothetical protein